MFLITQYTAFLFRNGTSTTRIITTDVANDEVTDIVIHPLRESDIEAADRICRLAFGTFIGLQDPLQFFGDADYIRTRLRADPSAAFAAEANGELVGSNFVANWGSLGIFGPLTVRPDFWDKGIAKQLLKSTMEYFAKLGTRHIGLFTWSHSPKHLGLYQRFGFWPRFLTAIMAKQLDADPPKTNQTMTLDKNKTSLQLSKYSEIKAGEDRRGYLDSCRMLTNAIYDGLDVQLEINSVNNQSLGDTVLLWQQGNDYESERAGAVGRRKLVGLAVCHCGAGTEAGSRTCYIKFGAVLPDDNAPIYFHNLIDACETFAKVQGMSRLLAGVNTGRHQAYRKLISLGFRTEIQGVVMDRPNEPVYNKPEIYLIDDWR
jgi:predicted N-acetyltransferase YhbS